MPRRLLLLTSLLTIATVRRVLVVLDAAGTGAGAASGGRVPRAVTAFYTGLSAMQTTQEVLARQKFDRVIALVPQEPAGWANLGLLLLRQQELEQGAQQLARAATLAPDSPEIHRLQALAESRRGNLAEPAQAWGEPRGNERPVTGGGPSSWIPMIWSPRTRSRSRPSGRAERRTTRRPSASSSGCSRAAKISRRASSTSASPRSAGTRRP